MLRVSVLLEGEALSQVFLDWFHLSHPQPLPVFQSLFMKSIPYHDDAPCFTNFIDTFSELLGHFSGQQDPGFLIDQTYFLSHMSGSQEL